MDLTQQPDPAKRGTEQPLPDRIDVAIDGCRSR